MESSLLLFYILGVTADYLTRSSSICFKRVIIFCSMPNVFYPAQALLARIHVTQP